MILFRILWGFDALVTIVVVYFFFEGVGDGTVSASNLGLWFLILIALAGILFGSIWLRTRKRFALSKALLFILAVPCFLYFLIIAIFILSGAKWQ
jgi:hypothetical protein